MELVPPSPKDHAYVYGGSPPETLLVNDTLNGATPLVGFATAVTCIGGIDRTLMKKLYVAVSWKVSPTALPDTWICTAQFPDVVWST
jgi:hypothetical protein